MPEYIATLSISIIVAIVSARVTVFWALRRFREEQMWSRKVDEYAAILEALHVVKEEASDYMLETEENRDRSEEQKEDSYGKSREAQRRIQKALDMGGFLLRSDANTALIDVLKGIDSAKDQPKLYDQAGDVFDAIQKCVNSISAIAKEDLRLTGRWWSYRKRRMPHE